MLKQRCCCCIIEDTSTPHGEGNATSLQYSCLENPMDGGAWWAAVHGVARSWTQLSDLAAAAVTICSDFGA